MLIMVKTMMPFPMLVPMMKPILNGLAKDIAAGLVKNTDLSSVVSVASIRDEIDALMTEKLKLLTPEIVKTLMEEVIREHLGWLIVWGNVFGGLIGIITLTVRAIG